MPPEAVPSNASVASTGKGIRYIGEHAYAFSGQILVDDNITSLCDFTTGSGYILATLMFASGTQSGDDYQYTTKLNSAIIDRYHTSGGVVAPDRVNRKILIPPFTHVELQAQNVTDTSAGGQMVTMTGRVYGED